MPLFGTRKNDKEKDKAAQAGFSGSLVVKNGAVNGIHKDGYGLSKEREYYGLENFGNTCYVNSVLQTLFYTKSFCQVVTAYPPILPSASSTNTVNSEILNGSKIFSDTDCKCVSPSSATCKISSHMQLPSNPECGLSLTNPYSSEPSLLTCIKDLFCYMSNGIPTRIEDGLVTNVVSPHRFMDVLRQKNELYTGSMHQDAHEFLNFLLNALMEDIERHASVVLHEDRKIGRKNCCKLRKLFQGILVSETKCLTCENVTSRDEEFLDLSIDIEAHTSVTACLRQFSASEMLCERNKFHCDVCGGLQEAERRMKIKHAPHILALHLKRFKYTESLHRMVKLLHRVVYPSELRLTNTIDDSEENDCLYELYAVVVHIGGGAYHGHYVAIIRTDDYDCATRENKPTWILFDDEKVEKVDDGYVYRFFGDGKKLAQAYVLFYRQKEDRNIGIEIVDANIIETPMTSTKNNSFYQDKNISGTSITNGLNHEIVLTADQMTDLLDTGADDPELSETARTNSMRGQNNGDPYWKLPFFGFKKPVLRRKSRT